MAFRDASNMLVWASSALLLAACAAGGAVVSSTTEPTAIASMPTVPTLPTGDLPPVSISNPSPGAKDAFEKCHVGDMIPFDQVAGMGQVPSATDLYQYVPLTGREREFKEDIPAWVIQFRGDIPQGAEIWTAPTCIVMTTTFGYYLTGPVKDLNTGKVRQPEPPPVPPDKSLPPLVP